MDKLINKLYTCHDATYEELLYIINSNDKNVLEDLIKMANDTRNKIYGHKVFFRGLIEISSYCKNNCYYCGIRCNNHNANRYRLTKEDILNCCDTGYLLGFRTFVLQGGEDPYFKLDTICDIVTLIKKKYSNCAITLSLGEWSKEAYQSFYNSGADRYLLRHETSNTIHYNKLHPSEMLLKKRIECLYNLKEIGFQTGAGFMVGSPYQTNEMLAQDLIFLKNLNPQMVGIGPFIPHKDTPFKDMKAGTLEITLKLLALVRLLLPNVLLPSTTALGTIEANGREQGLLAGANVVMPNLSPQKFRKSYSLYDNKISTGEEAAEGLNILTKKLKTYGFELSSERGDYID